MYAFNTPPLLLDNERLRETMREREQLPVRPAGGAVVIRQLAKPSTTRLLANCVLPATAGGEPWPQQHWPDPLRQLHWELCSSTLLRPLARLMDTPPLLPDPFALQGRLLNPDQPGPAVIDCHPVTGLTATLQLALVLAGDGDVMLPDGTRALLHAGDAVLIDAASTAGYPPGAMKRWVAVYYTHARRPQADGPL